MLFILYKNIYLYNSDNIYCIFLFNMNILNILFIYYIILLYIYYIIWMLYYSYREHWDVLNRCSMQKIFQQMLCSDFSRQNIKTVRIHCSMQ